MCPSTPVDNHALVYLFGAGASHPALPLSRDVSSRMSHWGRTLAQYAEKSSEREKTEKVTGLSSELLHWGTEASSHFSVDTLAKKLFLTSRQDDLWRLKAAMSAFFILEQSAGRAEQRYDSFFAAILELPGKPPTIPENIWLLTWNYDRMFERAYHQYCPDVNLVQDNITFCKRVVRLNGLLGRGINKGTGDEYNLSLEEDKTSVYERVSDEYWQLRSHTPAITFAFEKSQELDSRLKPLADMTCTLVIVGYSFPFFNRRFDRIVLNAFKSIDEVFLQVLPEHSGAISRRLKTLRELPSIELVDDREQFFVPYGL
jgi:hypothetical protein